MKIQNKRKGREYLEWREAVFKRDAYKCTKCDDTDKKLHAHHIIGWDENPELRVDVNNGMTLCTSCHNKEHHIGRVPWNKGKVTTDEAKEKMRAAKLGKKASLETKEKISKANKGKVFSKETCLKISLAKRGKKFSEEHKEKLSDAKKGKSLSQAHRLSLKNAKTPEMIEANKIRHKGRKWIIDLITEKRKWID